MYFYRLEYQYCFLKTGASTHTHARTVYIKETASQNTKHTLRDFGTQFSPQSLTQSAFSINIPTAQFIYILRHKFPYVLTYRLTFDNQRLSRSSQRLQHLGWLTRNCIWMCKCKSGASLLEQMHWKVSPHKGMPVQNRGTDKTWNWTIIFQIRIFTVFKRVLAGTIQCADSSQNAI